MALPSLGNLEGTGRNPLNNLSIFNGQIRKMELN